MELNPRLRFRSPMEIPFKIPKSITVLVSIGLFSKKFRRSATWRLQYVTIRCQLVSVVAAKNKTIIYLYSEFFETQKRWSEIKICLPNWKPRLLMRALLQMTMETDDATERNNAPITPNWKPDNSPIFCEARNEMSMTKIWMYEYNKYDYVSCFLLRLATTIMLMIRAILELPCDRIMWLGRSIFFG